jgi:hypothetical protein
MIPIPPKPGDLVIVDLAGWESGCEVLPPLPPTVREDGIPVPGTGTPSDCYRLLVIATGEVVTVRGSLVWGTGARILVRWDA